MHTVIVSECTGCELCVAPCPVDCIVMVPLSPSIDNVNLQKYTSSQLAKRRYDARNLRKEKESVEKAERAKQKRAELIKKQSESMQQ
jgi:electron transport complex protein RnfB